MARQDDFVTRHQICLDATLATADTSLFQLISHLLNIMATCRLHLCTLALRRVFCSMSSCKLTETQRSATLALMTPRTLSMIMLTLSKAYTCRHSLHDAISSTNRRTSSEQKQQHHGTATGHQCFADMSQRRLHQGSLCYNRNQVAVRTCNPSSSCPAFGSS